MIFKVASNPNQFMILYVSMYLYILSMILYISMYLYILSTDYIYRIFIEFYILNNIYIF